VALAIAEAVRGIDPELALLGLAGSALVRAAESVGLRAVREAFLDRGYRADGTLVPRGQPGALIEQPELAAERAVRLVREGAVTAVEGTRIAVHADSFCVHGDGRAAVPVLRAVRARLAEEGIAVAPFAR
ncbi:MAG TPA: LamB/YcsF family protein, partial [Gemmatimonadales bacterium]|nr:LamB/YcsF family protein [Gemmatimonadales bacterium]